MFEKTPVLEIATCNTFVICNNVDFWVGNFVTSVINKLKEILMLPQKYSVISPISFF